MNKFIHLIVLNLFISCAFFNAISKSEKETGTSGLSASQGLYDLKDKSGEFELTKKSGFETKSKVFATKYLVYSPVSKKDILEKGIALSEMGVVNKVPVFRPKVSQFSVWFEGKKYFSQLRVLSKERKLEVKLESPETQWQGTYTLDIPKSDALFCFYSQVVDCVAATGFLERAIKQQRGEVSLQIIWDNFPYFGEQYLDVPTEVFSQASLSYDGKTDEGENRFSFNFGSQNIYYVLDKNSHVKKVFWIAQGYSLIRR